MFRPKLHSPLGVDLKITNACNLHCTHCLASSGRASQDELSLPELFGIVDQLQAARVFYLGITGGEPLMRPELLELIRYAAGKELRICLTTNGTLLDAEKAAALRQAGVWLVRVSLDYPRAEDHDRFRATPGCFEATLNGIRHMVAVGVPITVLTVITRDNFRSWEAMLPLCKQLGVSALNTYLFVPEGRGRLRRQLALSPAEHREFARRVVELQQRGAAVKLVTESPLIATLRGEADSGACAAGTYDLFVKESGDVTPCPYFPVVLGNVRRQSLDAIWNGSELLERLRNPEALAPECRRCDFGESCFGGCRAAAHCERGTISAVDPNCWVAPESGRDA